MILSYLLAILAVGVVVDFFLVRRIQAEGLGALREQLTASIHLIEPYFAGAKISPENQKNLEGRLKQFSAHGALRLALYSREGLQVAALGMPDPVVPATVLPYEIQDAQLRGQAFGSRTIPGAGAILFFVKKIEAGLLEAGLPIQLSRRLVRPARTILWLGIFAWMGLSLLLSRVYFKRLERVLSRGRRLVKKFERDEVSGIFPVPPHDEFETMGNWMNQMSEGLEKKIGELTRERNQLQAILDTMQEGVIFLDSAGNIALMNPAAGKFLGIDRLAWGRPPIEVIRNPDLQESFDEALSGGEVKNREIRILRGAHEVFLLVQATSLSGIQGGKGAILAFIDITHLKRLERIRQDFVENVSHELKTPLTSIQGYVETLIDGGFQDSNQARNFLGIIENNARRLSKLVEDLLRLSEIESQKFVLHQEEIDIADLFSEIAALHEVKLKKKGMEVVFSPDLEKFSSDRNVLVDILGNLLDNAIKYGNPKTAVRLASEKSGKHVRFSVRDEGIGIEASQQGRIFERFYRVDKSRSRQEGGTGLGLSIVKHLVQQLEGEVWVESEYGEGTTFFFILPLEPLHP